MAQIPECPTCRAIGRKGMNVYKRDDGTFKCRTCGNVFVKPSEQKPEEEKE